MFFCQKNESCLGIELFSEGLFAVLLEKNKVRYHELIPLNAAKQWPSALWLYPQWLAQGLHEIHRRLPRYQGHVSINLPLDVVHQTVLSFEGNPDLDSDPFRKVCHKYGIEINDHHLIRYARLAPDCRHQKAHLFQVVSLKRQIHSVLQQLCQSLKWHLTRLDLAAYSRARGWWAISDAWPGQRAELYISKCSQGLEMSLFLNKRLLDWRNFSGTTSAPIEQYLTQIPTILTRFPGVQLYQIRSLDSQVNQFLSHMNLSVSRITKAGYWQDDLQLGAYGAALGGVQI